MYDYTVTIVMTLKATDDETARAATETARRAVGASLTKTVRIPDFRMDSVNLKELATGRTVINRTFPTDR